MRVRAQPVLPCQILKPAPPAVGSSPQTGFDVKILEDEGSELPYETIGEICGYGGGIMRERHRRE